MSQVKSNPEINPNYEEKSNQDQNDYSMVEKQVLKFQHNKAVQQHIPDNPIDTAHLLIENSDTTALMLEADKELKVANLDAIEKYQIYLFTSVWNDIMFLQAQQEKREIEAKVKFGKNHDCGGEEALLETIDNQLEMKEPVFFDAAGTYKKGRFVAILSRAKLGFERIQQIRTISDYKMEQSDITEKSPGFMQKFMGGFNRK